MSHLILVGGATGGVGRHLVQQLTASGHPVRALVRDAQKAQAVLGSAVALAVGDTRQPDTLVPALAGVWAVICATGTRTPVGPDSPQFVDYEGVRNLAAAAESAGVVRFVLVSSMAVTQPNHPLNNFGQVLTWKLKGEDAVRGSGLDYTIVRPGGLTDEPAGRKALRFDQGDRMMGLVSRGDVARVCIALLAEPHPSRTTFEVIEAEGPAQTSLAEMFVHLQPDPLA